MKLKLLPIKLSPLWEILVWISIWLILFLILYPSSGYVNLLRLVGNYICPNYSWGASIIVFLGIIFPLNWCATKSVKLARIIRGIFK